MTRPTRPAVPPEDEPGSQPGFGQPDEPRPSFTPRAPSPGPGMTGQQPSGPQVVGQYEPGLYQADPCDPDPPRHAAHPPADPYAQRLYPEAGQAHPGYPPAPVPPGPPLAPMPAPGPDAGRPAPGQTRPTFTPREQGPPDGPGNPRGPRHGDRRRDEGRPRPSFTPRDGYTPPPPDSRRRAANYPPPSAFLPPPGFPQPTQVIDMPRDGVPPGTVPPRTPDADTSPNLARNAKVMALGTIASRVTGFLRTFVFIIALGSTTPIANAYNNSNTLPNTVYYLMLGGIFTSVIVPMLVSASKNDPDKGEGYAERIFTLGVIALLSVTVIATVLASPLVSLYSSVNGPPGSKFAAEHHLMVLFAYFFIPQIFFYGMDSLLGAILNVRGRFGANMWTPVINNVIVITVGAAFIVAYGTDLSDPRKLPASATLLLGLGTTAGILVQSICLFPVLRKAGFSMRLRMDLRRSEISEIGRQAGWLLGYVISQSAGNLVVQRVANVAGKYSSEGYSAYAYAWSLFQLPYAIVGISVISALLPRMSGHATDRRYSKVRDDFSTGVRLASVIVVPSAVFLAVLGAPLCEVLFSYGAESAANARYIGEVFGVFSLGLVPFMLTQLQLRVFYSFHQNRTPALIGVVMLVVGIVGDLIALNVLPPGQVVVGLAAAYGLVTMAGAVISWPLLLRRVGSLDGWKITRSLIRMFLATLPGLALILVIEALFGSFMHAGPVYGLATTVIGGGGALLLYAVCARLLKVEEFTRLVATLGGRFRR